MTKRSTQLLTGLLLILSCFAAPAHAQTARDLTDIGIELYQKANSPAAQERMRQDLINAPEAYLVNVYQPGTLVLLNRRRVRVPAMKYNVALHLLEVRDSTGSHVWPPGSLDGFYLGKGSDARHFRSYSIRASGNWLDFVEVLNAVDDAPLVLAVRHIYRHVDAQINPILRTEDKPARSEINQMVLAGSGRTPKEPLREVSLNQRGISKLFGTSAAEVDAYATKEHLSYTDLAQVLRMVEFYNQQQAK